MTYMFKCDADLKKKNSKSCDFVSSFLKQDILPFCKLFMIFACCVSSQNKKGLVSESQAEIKQTTPGFQSKMLKKPTPAK